MKKIEYLVLFLMLLSGNAMAKQPATFTVATYNVRLANHGDSVNGNGWGKRAPYVAKVALFHEFDIFGTQEGFYEQLKDLKRLMPGYEYIGVGREDGKKEGEHSAIFYRTDKFKMLEHGDFWLSEDQTKPNRGWDAVCIRVCTWGKFKELSTGLTFVYFNLHMDHKGVKAREESAKLILKKIQEMPKGTPVILSGDFNVDQFSSAYKLLNTSGIVRDAYDKATLIYEPVVGTFNGFDSNNVAIGRIDHIFLTDNFTVSKYGILDDTYQATSKENGNKVETRFPSDHFPVVITVDVK
jgi:endonuclease/exonuclease/phosphatase family metal-dependent hydrolase